MDSLNPTVNINRYNKKKNNYVESVEAAFNAIDYHDIPGYIARVPGTSGQSYRKFVNALVSKLDDPRYMEIGSLIGSTVCAALTGNKVSALCVENWSGNSIPDQTKHLFQQHVGLAMTDKLNSVAICESDYKSIDYTQMGKYNIFLLDGPSSQYERYLGLMLAQPALDDQYILLVSDWNWPQVRNGISQAIKTLKSNILFDIEVRTSLDDNHVVGLSNELSNWHNGNYIAVIQK